MTGRLFIKRAVQACALILVFVPALLSGFGRLHAVYTFFAHSYAAVPGLPGNLLRAAFYRLTLRQASIDATISFGTFFSHAGASLEPMVSIGSYCVIGAVRIGARTQIASHVEIPSGARAHQRDEEGRLSGQITPGQITPGQITGDGGATTIGPDCWIGSSAIVLADVGAGSTIGAGAVVVKPIPPGSVAVGNPARVIRSTGEPRA